MAEWTPDHRQLLFTRFDPVKGRGAELIRFDADPNAEYIWDLSPDGTRIALVKSGEKRIVILSLPDRTAREIVPKRWSSFETLDWAADGERLFAASRTQQNSVLLSVDLQGNVKVIWEQQGTLGNEAAGTSGIPSPNGRYLAMMGFTVSGNMWIMEGF
jgi:Tol biopolymer transport system component